MKKMTLVEMLKNEGYTEIACGITFSDRDCVSSLRAMKKTLRSAFTEP